jgi:hypothetical protein
MGEIETHDCSNCGLDAARASRPRQTEEGSEPAGRRRWPRFSAGLNPKQHGPGVPEDKRAAATS